MGGRGSTKALFSAAFGLGALAGLAALVIYAVSGFGWLMSLTWLTGLLALCVFFWSRSAALPRVARADLFAPVGLVLLFSPLYLLALFRWPVQVSGDEVAISEVAEAYSDFDDPHGVDPFGVSFYLNRPTLLFLGWGKLGSWIGGFDLFHMRLLHAIFGLLTIAATYVLLRQLLPRGWALFGAVVFGSSHAFLMISRLAMRENTAVLVMVLALTLLLWGLRNAHELATFLGGLTAGLAFYVYYPARVTLPIWLAFLVLLALVSRQAFPARRLLGLGAIAVAGLVLMATPILISESNIPPQPGPSDTEAQKDSLLIFADARERQRQWVFADSVWEGYRKNVEWGLGAFNNEVADQGFIYWNPGHGFVDPLTGVLLWLGVGVLGFRLLRRRADDGAILAVTGFLILWLSFAFLVNKAPNYTRLLITLPFVAYLVTEAVRWLAGRWSGVRQAPAVIAGAAAIALVAWNLAIAWDFVDTGRTEGHEIGSTGRWVHEHRDVPGQKFFIASTTDGAWDYFSYGDEGAYKGRLRYFAASDEQVRDLVPPGDLKSFDERPPFAVFMVGDLWKSIEGALHRKYPQGRLLPVMPDGSKVVFEVTR